MKIIYKGSFSPEHRQASKAFSNGNYKEAFELWANIYDHNQNDALALKGMGLCALLNDRTREALSYLDDALALSANDAEIYNLQALSALKNHDSVSAINTLLNAMERVSSPLLQNTLSTIQNTKNAHLANNISVFPLIQITIAKQGFFSLDEKMSKSVKKWALVLILPLLILLITIFYPNIRNTVLNLNIRNRNLQFAEKATIKDLQKIIDARSEYSILLDEKTIKKRYQELQKALSDNQFNLARILINQLKESNASLAVQERVGILEGFVPSELSPQLDYVPSYREVAIAPKLYQGVGVYWKGTIVNFQHEGRQASYFDLLINPENGQQVEGIANIMIDGFHELNNNQIVSVLGTIEGITPDNRIIIKANNIIK